MIDHSAGDSARVARLAAAGLADLQGLLLSLELGITDGRVGVRNSGHHATGKVTLLVSKPIGTTIDRSSDGGLIHPLLWIDVHALGEHVGQLIVFLAERLLVVGGRGETGRDVKRDTWSSSVGYTGDGVRTNAAGTKTRKEGSAMSRSRGGGHGDLGKWAEGSRGRWTVGGRRGPGTASG